METDKIIMYESDEAASVKNLTGWVSSTGRFWGKDEHMARYEGCTHKKCECGNVTSKSWIKCETCRDKIHNENYNKLPFKEWDGEAPLYDDVSDKFFFSEEELTDYIYEYKEDNGEEPPMKLYLCEEQKFFPVDSGYWSDIMPEEMDELPKAIQEALDNLNKVIKEAKPASWTPGKFRTEYKFVDSEAHTLKQDNDK